MQGARPALQRWQVGAVLLFTVCRQQCRPVPWAMQQQPAHSCCVGKGALSEVEGHQTCWAGRKVGADALLAARQGCFCLGPPSPFAWAQGRGAAAVAQQAAPLVLVNILATATLLGLPACSQLLCMLGRTGWWVTGAWGNGAARAAIARVGLMHQPLLGFGFWAPCIPCAGCPLTPSGRAPIAGAGHAAAFRVYYAPLPTAGCWGRSGSKACHACLPVQFVLLVCSATST